MEVHSNLRNEFGLSKKTKRKSDGVESVQRVMDDQSPKKKAKMVLDSFSSMKHTPNKDNSGIPDSPKKKKKVSSISKSIVKLSPKKQRLKITNSVVNSDSSHSEVYNSPSKKMPSTFIPQSEESSSDFEEETSNYQSFSKPASPLKKSMNNEPKPAEISEGEIFGWSKEEMVTLINNIMKVVPAKDRVKFQVRSKRIDWNQVEFGDHSANECCEQWSKLEPHIRSFRTMKEILSDALEWLDHPTMILRKDFPDMPKKPLSSYMLFLQERRDKIVKKFPGKSMKEYSKIFGEKFKALPEEKKAKYAEQAKLLTLKYKEEMETFKQNHPELALLMLKSKKVKQKSSMNLMKPPNKPLSAFRLYFTSNLPLKDGDMSKKEFLNKLRVEWKNLSTKKKIPWLKMSKDNEAEYLEELKAFVEEHPEIPVTKYKPVISKMDEKILDKLDGKPEAPPRSAYGLFSSLMLQDPSLKESAPSFTERLQEIGKLWKIVPEEDKQSYADKVKQMNEEYEEKCSAYINSLSPEKRAHLLSKDKKLKQTSLFDSFLTKKESRSNESNVREESDDDNNDDDDDNNDFDYDDDCVDDLEQKDVEKLKKILIAKQPTPPPKSGFEVYKKHFLVKKPGLKESKINMKWNSLPKEAKSKYIKEFEKLKSNYLLKFKQFIEGLSPDELRVYKTMEQKPKEGAPGDSDFETD